jgi:hypothetical protein
MTEELTYQTINKNDERIKEIEKIRSEAFHIAPGDYFKNKIEEEKILAIACYYNNTLVAGAYISQSMNCFVSVFFSPSCFLIFVNSSLSLL